MRLSPTEKANLVEEVGREPRRLKRLKELGIATSTFYTWKRRYQERGREAFIERTSRPRRVWNRLGAPERELIEAQARKHTELSPRLLALMLTERFETAVGESTVYRLLRSKGLVRERPLDRRPAAKVWKKPTKRVDELWQLDGTNFFIPEFGYYKCLVVLDDRSRRVLSATVRRDESSQSASDAFEIAIEESRRLGHALDKKPVLLSDNGSGFAGEVFAKYLKVHGIRHIFGAPYHPQTQGKVERFNRTMKEKVNLWVYGTPEDLQAAVDRMVEQYNRTPHEGLKNVSPEDVYAGRQNEVLKRREKIRLETMARRYAYNMGRTFEAHVFSN